MDSEKRAFMSDCQGNVTEAGPESQAGPDLEADLEDRTRLPEIWYPQALWHECPLLEKRGNASRASSWKASRRLSRRRRPRQSFAECAPGVPTTLRVNSLHATPEEIAAFFREEGVKHRRVPWCPQGFILSELRERDVQRWDSYRDGRIYLQSLSSMVPALALGPRPGEHVLDIAAAPGSKTTQMAAMMENSGSILAVELDPVRAQRLAYNVALQGCGNVAVRAGRGRRSGRKCPAASTGSSWMFPAPERGDSSLECPPLRDPGPGS